MATPAPRTGLCSVTFRQMTPDEVIAAARSADIDAIEWGGDLHVPHGDIATARRVGDATRAAGIATPSYGSYYRCLPFGERPPVFEDVLETACALGAQAIRVWAGLHGPTETPRAEYDAVVADLRRTCAVAAGRGVDIGLESHEGTLTETAESALNLLRDVAAPNLHLYWQPRHRLSAGENVAEIEALRTHIRHLHVFHWNLDDGRIIRRPLSEGRGRWLSYLRALGTAPDRCCILEFVRDDDPANMAADAGTLRALLAEATGTPKSTQESK